MRPVVKTTDVPNIVTRRLQAAKTGVPEEAHLDPDLMTAFVEKALPQREHSRTLEHLAHCANCREVIALSLPEQPDIAAATPIIPARATWLSWPVLRWGTLAACVVVVGAAVTLHYQLIRAGQPSITASSTDAPTARSQFSQAPAGESARDTKQVAAQVPPEPQKSEARLDRPAPTERTGDGNSAIQGNIPAAGNKLQAEHEAAPAHRQTEDVAGASPLLANAEPAADSSQLVPGRAKDEFDAFPAAKTGMSLNGTIDTAKQPTPTSAMIARAATVPANVTPRWTLTSDGMLQRSIDSGKTWETILVASPGTFRALTANGFDIWVGGAKAALYHSIDAGQHWMKVQPAAADESLTADIIGIEFTDLLHGTLTTADQQAWITADAGQTWQKQ
jgi:hypothetical protein